MGEVEQPTATHTRGLPVHCASRHRYASSSTVARHTTRCPVTVSANAPGSSHSLPTVMSSGPGGRGAPFGSFVGGMPFGGVVVTSTSGSGGGGTTPVAVAGSVGTADAAAGGTARTGPVGGGGADGGTSTNTVAPWRCRRDNRGTRLVDDLGTPRRQAREGRTRSDHGGHVTAGGPVDDLGAEVEHAPGGHGDTRQAFPIHQVHPDTMLAGGFRRNRTIGPNIAGTVMFRSSQWRVTQGRQGQARARAATRLPWEIRRVTCALG